MSQGSAAIIRLLLLSVLFASVGAGAATDDTAGLAAYFPFDGSAGEASGVKIFGQLVTAGGVASGSNPEYVDGRFGNAIRFSGGPTATDGELWSSAPAGTWRRASEPTSRKARRRARTSTP